jgi:hypothetical protein
LKREIYIRQITFVIGQGIKLKFHSRAHYDIDFDVNFDPQRVLRWKHRAVCLVLSSNKQSELDTVPAVSRPTEPSPNREIAYKITFPFADCKEDMF